MTARPTTLVDAPAELPEARLAVRSAVVSVEGMRELVSAIVRADRPSVTLQEAALSSSQWSALVGWAEQYASHPIHGGNILSATRQACWRQVLRDELSTRGRQALAQLEAHADAVHDAEREAAFALGLAAGACSAAGEPRA